ncbi:hypothetical protein NSMS1_63470 (plasmid) [Nostoc sp. MS1]|nr:hypothetical protein NSMS1_63470 [Nostoc sp. MS1]
MIFSRFIEDQNVDWFIGKSTLPLTIKERQMIILGMKTERHQDTTPLIWSIFELFLNLHLDSKKILACDKLSFFHLSKHNYQQPIIALPKEFNQEISVNYVVSKNTKTISSKDELAKRTNEVDFIFPIIKV